MLLLALFAASLGSGSAAFCDVTGIWQFKAGYVEQYNITMTGVTTFTVACVTSGECLSWKTANGTLSEPSQVSVHFHGPVTITQTGVFAPDCSYMDWNDDVTDISCDDGRCWLRPPKPRDVVAHFIPHSHVDPGWLETVDQLFQKEAQYIYDNIFESLSANPQRTFAVEIVIFWEMWWAQQNATTRAQVQRLVNNGQLEFMGGGWVQNDEAATYYSDTIDQLTLGHLWTQNALNTIPTVGWQADPFGHATSEALMFSQFGWDGFVFGRPMTAGDPINTLRGQIWHPFRTFADTDHAIFLKQHPGYWEPFRDNHDALARGDTATVTANLVFWIENLAQRLPQSKNILVMFGDDFAWQDGVTLYNNLDKVFANINANSETLHVTAQYSSPSKWIAALNKENLTWTGRFESDMFPLGAGEFPWWSGFFTTRPDYKLLFRSSATYWHAATQLHTTAFSSASWASQFTRLAVMWKALSLVQHHDAMPADSHNNVMDDFAARVMRGIYNASSVMGELIGAQQGVAAPAVCYNASMELCSELAALLSGGQPAQLTIYNPLGWVRQEFAEVLVPRADVAVFDDQGAAVPAQTQPVGSKGAFLLAFSAQSLPALGYRCYTLRPGTGGQTVASTQSSPSGSFVAENSIVSLAFTPNGTLTSVTNARSGVVVNVVPKIVYYQSKPNSENAWDFSTDGNDAVYAFSTDAQAAVVFRGPLYTEVQASVDPTNGLSLTYRLYANDSHVRFLVGAAPFDMRSLMNRDVSIRFDTDIASGGAFYSDANGLEYQYRQLNWRTWNPSFVDPNYPISCNYYPITSGALLNDTRASLSFISQNSHGVASFQNGSIEVMVHRIWLAPDLTTLPPNHHITAASWLLFGDSASAMSLTRPLSYRMLNSVVLFAGPAGTTVSKAYAPIAALPPAVHLLSLQIVPSNIAAVMTDGSTPQFGSVFLRLAGIYAAGESSLAVPTTVDLSNLFDQWSVDVVGEYVLNGILPRAARMGARLRWIEADAKEAMDDKGYVAALRDTSVAVGPMDIRTFVLSLSPK